MVWSRRNEEAIKDKNVGLFLRTALSGCTWEKGWCNVRACSSLICLTEGTATRKATFQDRICTVMNAEAQREAPQAWWGQHKFQTTGTTSNSCSGSRHALARSKDYIWCEDQPRVFRVTLGHLLVAGVCRACVYTATHATNISASVLPCKTN